MVGIEAKVLIETLPTQYQVVSKLLKKYLQPIFFGNDNFPQSPQFELMRYVIGPLRLKVWIYYICLWCLIKINVDSAEQLYQEKETVSIEVLH